MRKGLLCAAFVTPLMMLSPALAMTDAECADTWTKTDANKDGVITELEGARYVAALRTASKTVPEKGLDQAMFTQSCKDGVFDTRQTDAGAPLKGANSFTEDQAKDRIIGAGMTGVSALKKDADGIWRGTAANGDKSMNVGVDFKGNVVTN